MLLLFRLLFNSKVEISLSRSEATGGGRKPLPEWAWNIP